MTWNPTENNVFVNREHREPVGCFDECRNDVGVTDTNIYVCAKPQSDHDCLRTYSYDSSTIQHPMRSLRGVMHFRAIMNMPILLRCCTMLTI